MANYLSWIMVPLMMPTYGMILVFTLSYLRHTLSFGAIAATVLVVFGITAFLPLVAVYLMKMFGLVEDVGLNGRKERLLPYIVTLLSYIACGWYIYCRGLPSWMVMFFAGGAVASLVNMLVNFKWKISAHAAGAAGVAAILATVTSQAAAPGPFIALIAWIALCGILGAARIYLDRHTPLQVMAGFVVGYLSVWLMDLIKF